MEDECHIIATVFQAQVGLFCKRDGCRQGDYFRSGRGICSVRLSFTPRYSDNLFPISFCVHFSINSPYPASLWTIYIVAHLETYQSYAAFKDLKACCHVDVSAVITAIDQGPIVQRQFGDRGLIRISIVFSYEPSLARGLATNCNCTDASGLLGLVTMPRSRSGLECFTQRTVKGPEKV